MCSVTARPRCAVASVCPMRARSITRSPTLAGIRRTIRSTRPRMPLNGGTDTVIYGPTTCGPSSCAPAPGATPTYLGPGTNPEWVAEHKPRATSAAGRRSILTWRILTGIVLPQGIRDPYVYNDFLSIQRQIFPKTVLEVDYVGTISHKLFRAQDINRQSGRFACQLAQSRDGQSGKDCAVRHGIRTVVQTQTMASCATGRTPSTAPTMGCRRL